MSRQPENTFIASVHRHLPVDLYRIKNNNMYNSGQPDVWYSGHKADLWVEYKFVVLPKRDDTPIVINLSELQKAWLRHRHDEGRSVGVMVGCKEGGVWFPDTSWNQKTLAAEFRRKMLDRRTLASIIERATAG